MGKSPDNLSPSDKEKRQIEIRSFEGPLPHPQILSEYNEISPDFAGRIVTVAESEAKHRHNLEEKALKAQAWEIRPGQILGFLIGTFTIAAGSFCAIRGAQIAGSIIGSSGVEGLVSAFILGRRSE